MKNKKLLLILAAAVSLSMTMTACNFGGDDIQEEIVATPTPEPTEAPEPTPTIAPDVQDSTYTTADKKVSIKLPDATWSDTNSTDAGVYSFESPEQGRIRVLYGKGEEALSAYVAPSTQDTVSALESAAGMTEGTDFEIGHFKSVENNGVSAYEYIVRYLNTEKSDGNAYVVKRVYINSAEYCEITAYVKQADSTALSNAVEAVKSFKILGNSSLKAFGKKSEAAQGAANAGISEAAMTDTSQTRTIYRNSDGSPLVVQNDGNGNWTDDSGNTYNFVNDTDVYDQNNVDYYYHGEAADVYYMPVSGE